MRPELRRLIWGILGFIGCGSAMKLVAYLSGDFSLTDAPARGILVLLVLVVLGTGALISTAFACAGIAGLTFARNKADH